MVQKAEKEDLAAVAALAILMWLHHSMEELTEEFSELFFQNPEAAFFLKYEEGIPVGFAQCQLRRDYVEGAQTCPVGYLEGIFVREEFRRKGYAKELLAACETWAQANGCTEFASDCELDNTGSFPFHMATGFREANRIICFIKKIPSPPRHTCSWGEGIARD